MTPAPNPPPVAESVEVTQADREAARFAVECVTDSPPKRRPEFADLWEDDLARAFARHRAASHEAGRIAGVREGLERAAKVADASKDGLTTTHTKIATSIRALSKGEIDGE